MEIDQRPQTRQNNVIQQNLSAAHPAKALDAKEIISFFKTLILFLVAFVVLRASIVEAYKIPSGSMIPTLLIGDHIFVNKLSYGFQLPIPALTFPLPFRDQMLYLWSTPSRGDIVVFTRPDDPDTAENESDTNIIKRVIGLPGETIEVKGTSVYVDNKLLDEPYAVWEDNGSPAGNFAARKVPAGHVMLLGDNRDASKDSRFWPYPFLEINRIKGRAFMIYWSWLKFGRIGQIIR